MKNGKRIIAICAAVLAAVSLLTGCGRSDADIEKNVKDLVVKIYKDKDITVTCDKVSKIEKADGENKYKAKAYISIPESKEKALLDVSVEYIDDNVVVKIDDFVNID